MKKASELTDDELRILIAEDQGWQKLEAGFYGEQECWFRNETKGEHVVMLPPNYPKDLNAIHEAERSLSEEDKYWYAEVLCNLANPKCGKMACVNNPEPGMYPGLVHATARQRAEAYVITKRLALL